MAEDSTAEPPAADKPNRDGSAPDAGRALAGATAEQPAASGAGAVWAPTGTGVPPTKFENVWSWTARKYRVRTVALLLVNLALFCGLCMFTHWLHVADPFDFSWGSYSAPLKFWGEQTQNLNDFVLYPISVEQNYMHGVVLGLLVASIVAVPISVAILYRFPFALPFAAAVAIFAHMPWMAITLVGSCVLAAVKPFRLSFRFGAALVAMLPVILYLYLATRGTSHQVGTYASPDQRLLLAAPWVLAILAACTMLGTILAISRVVNYRPGAVAPVMAVMFATPAILFHVYVGFDEVSYRVLEAEFGPRSRRFAAQDVTERMVGWLRARLRELGGKELFDVFGGGLERLFAMQHDFTHRLQRDFLADRRRADEACQAFIADHPRSRYVPNVLYIQGWVLDSRLDTRKLLLSGAPVRRELYSDYPHVRSEESWLALLTGYPDSPLAIAARLRLAQLHLRRGEVDEGLELLADLRQPQGRFAAGSETQPALRPWQRSDEPESSLGFDPQWYRREAQRLYELIQANRYDVRYGTAPLRELAGLDPHRPGWRNQLLGLAARYPDALLYDNILVRWADSNSDRDQRAEQLEACVRDFPHGDAAAEAMFRLAELRTQARGDDQEAHRQEGIKRMREVAERFGETCWGQEAARRLRILQPPAEPASPTAVPP